VTIRLLLADDQALVRGRWPPCCGWSPTSRSLPRWTGATGWCRLRWRSGPTCRVLVVTTFGRPGYLRRAMEAGASGFLVKDAPAEQLADAIRRVHAGLRVVDPALAAETLATGESPLTGRERDVLVAARDGGTVADIARLLVLSDGTVRNYLSSAMGKTGARTRAEAVLVAERRGWL